MQLGTMETRPKEAGIARIQFGCENKRKALPFRQGNRIVLPDNPQAEFFPLKDGRQFLFTCPTDPTMETPEVTRVHFGGTDETSAFLTRLIPQEPLAAFAHDGEKGFFDSLKPDLIKRLEETFGVAAQRQGDLFVVKLPYSWEQVSISGLLANEGRAEPKSVKAYPIGRTRHKLTGRYIEGLTAYFVEGTITAPHHAPLTLKGVHALVQAENLFNPAGID